MIQKTIENLDICAVIFEKIQEIIINVYTLQVYTRITIITTLKREKTPNWKHLVNLTKKTSYIVFKVTATYTA